MHISQLEKSTFTFIFIAITLVVSAEPVLAEPAGILFADMPVGTRLVTKSRSAFSSATIAEEYLGRTGDLYVTQNSVLQDDGSFKATAKYYYDLQGRKVKSVNNARESTYKPYSCHYQTGECTETYTYPNPFRDYKLVTNKKTYTSRIEDDVFILTYIKIDGALVEIPFELGPYNLRINSIYNNALNKPAGFELVELVVPE